MHISERHGKINKGVQDLTLPGLSSPSDSWTEGARQKELNERGAYIHRFQNQSSLSSMIAAVRKISEDNICTPSTLVGPSLCRTYNHHVWEGCAALLFSPSMPLALAYKGDIYSDRLSREPNLGHNRFKDPQRSRNESLELFSEAVCKTFNGYSSTSSAFKGRREKKLNLVVSAAHHAAKIKEMEKRANLYFIPEENQSVYQLDVPSKNLMLQLSDNYQHFGLQQKPTLQTKAQVLDFIDTVTQAKPYLLPFLNAARIKISTFKRDSVIPAYFAHASKTASKPAHQSSYAQFLQWQFDNSQTGANFHSFSDKSTTLTPNEVLGMPSVEDLVGLVVDPCTSKSFDQTLATLEHLKKESKSEWRSVAGNVPPFTHLISHMDQGTIIQLGWSKMVIPYSTKGLQEYCTSGKVTSIDKHKFSPDYFVLLHRLASTSILLFSKEHQTVNILYVKPNVIGNFSEIQSSSGHSLLYHAIEQSNIPDSTLRLFCYLDRLSSGSHNNLKKALGNPNKNAANAQILEDMQRTLRWGHSSGLNGLLESQINRIEKSIYPDLNNQRQVKYRAGFTDQGVFEYNCALGSLAMVEGTRLTDRGIRIAGIFKHCKDMKRGGSNLSFGEIVKEGQCTIGKMDGSVRPFTIIRKTKDPNNSVYLNLSMSEQSPWFFVNFSGSGRFCSHFVMFTKNKRDGEISSLNNPNWSGNVSDIIDKPAEILRAIAGSIKVHDELPDHRLLGSIICLSAFRFEILKQCPEAACPSRLKELTENMRCDTALDLANQFHAIIVEIHTLLEKLTQRYGASIVDREDLFYALKKYPYEVASPIQHYLADNFLPNTFKPSKAEFETGRIPYVSPPRTVAATPASAPSTPVIYNPSRTPPPRQSDSKQNLAKKFMQRLVNALNM
jgi:hypothetical protein